MKDASQYPVTFGYGATDGVYYGPNGSVGPYHRGDDRAMPVGTPVLVNGVQIGLSGTTGASSGPHLHIGRFVNGQDTNPHGLGFQITNGVVAGTGNDSTNGNYVRVADADDSSWVYLHLSRIDVTKGQKLEGGANVAKDSLTKEEIIVIYDLAFDVDDSQVNPDVISAFTGKTLDEFITFLHQDPSWLQHMKDINSSPGATTLNKGLYKVN